MLAKLTTPFKHPVAAPLFEIVPPAPQKNPTSPMLGVFMAAFKTQQSFNCFFPQDYKRVGR